MKIIISENQLNNLVEIITETDVICDNCGWSWKLSEGGDDPYICHKCWHNNETNLKK
jgi:tRNA(Ile2) C34 agmatinyltransferase TiaS